MNHRVVQVSLIDLNVKKMSCMANSALSLGNSPYGDFNDSYPENPRGYENVRIPEYLHQVRLGKMEVFATNRLGLRIISCC